MKKNPSKESLEEDGWDLKNIDSSSVDIEFEEVPELNWEDDESDNVEITPKEKDVIQELPLTNKNLNDREESGYNDIKKDKVNTDDKQIKIDSDFSNQNNENDQDEQISDGDIDVKINDSDNKDMNKIEKGMKTKINNTYEDSDDTDLNFMSRKNLDSEHIYSESDFIKNIKMVEDELSIDQSHKSSEFNVSLDVVSGVPKDLHLNNVVDNEKIDEISIQESRENDDEQRKKLIAVSEIFIFKDNKLEIIQEQKTTDDDKYMVSSSNIDEETSNTKEIDNSKFDLKNNENHNGQDDIKNKHITNELNAKVGEKMVEEINKNAVCNDENTYNKGSDFLVTDTSLLELDNLQKTQIEEENDEVNYESQLPQNKNIALSDLYINKNNENLYDLAHNSSDKNLSIDNTRLVNCYEDKLIYNDNNESAKHIVLNRNYVYDKRIIHERFSEDELRDNQGLTKCKLYNAELNNINKAINCADVPVNENDIKQDDRLYTEGIKLNSNGLNNARDFIITNSEIEEGHNEEERFKTNFFCNDDSKNECVTEECKEPASFIVSHKHIVKDAIKTPEDVKEGLSDNTTDNKILMEDRDTKQSSENENYLLNDFEVNSNKGEDLILKENNNSKMIQSNSKFENDKIDEYDLNVKLVSNEGARDDLDTLIKDVIIEENESIEEKDVISKQNFIMYDSKNKECNKNNVNCVYYNTNKEQEKLEKRYNNDELRDDTGINFGHEKHDRNTIESYDNFKDENDYLYEVNDIKNNTCENNHENINSTLWNVENVDDIEDKNSSFIINHETSEDETIEENIWSSEEDNFLGTPDQDFKNYQDVSYKKIKNDEINIETDKKLTNITFNDNGEDLNKKTDTLFLSGANHVENATKNTSEKILGDNYEGKNKFNVTNNNVHDLQKDDFYDVKNTIKTLDTNIIYNKNQINKLNGKKHEFTEENVILNNAFMHENEKVIEQNNANNVFVNETIINSSLNDSNTGQIYDKNDNEQVRNDIYVSKNDFGHDKFKGEPYIGNNETLEFSDEDVHLEYNDDINEIKDDTFATCNEIEHGIIVNSTDPFEKDHKSYDKDNKVYDDNNNFKLVKSNSNENILPEDVWGDDPAEFEFVNNIKESKNNDEFNEGKIKIVLNEQNDPNKICHKDNSEQNIYDLSIVDQSPNFSEKLLDEISNLNLHVVNENQTVVCEENHSTTEDILSNNYNEQTYNQKDLEVLFEQKKGSIKENDNNLKKHVNDYFDKINVNDSTNKITGRHTKSNDDKINNENIKRNIFIPRIKKDYNNSDNNFINNEVKFQDTTKQTKDFVGDNFINIDKNKMMDKSVFIPQAAKNTNIFKPIEKHTENSKDMYFDAFENTLKKNRKICLVALKNSFLITYPINQKRMDAKLLQEIEIIKYTHSFYASGDEKIISNKRKENKSEENLMDLINMKDLEFNKVIKETINFDVKVKNGDYKHNFKLDEQKFYDYYFSNTDYAIKRSIENNNWMLSFIFSWNDMVHREKVLVQFLNTFYHPETVGILMLKMGINDLKNLKNLQKNWKEYFLLSLQNYNKNFITKLILKIGEYNIHNALFCYIVVKRKLGDDLDILGLFNNNIFAIELLTLLEEKYEKVKDLDALLYHYILAVQRFNNDQAYKLYKKKKSRLRKEFVDVFDNLFVDKKWGFGGLRSVVDRGISRMIGIEVKEDVKKIDLNNNKKNSEILKKVQIRNDTETNMKSEKYFIPEVSAVNNDLKNHKANINDVNTHAQSKNSNTKEENSSNHDNNGIHYTRAVNNTEIMSRKFISTDDKVSGNMTENGAAIKDLVNKGPEPVNRVPLFMSRKESKTNLHEKELQDPIYNNENKAIIDKALKDVKIKNDKHKILKPLDSNVDRKYNNETEYSICNDLSINNKNKTDLIGNVESRIIDNKTNIDQGINHVNVENNINQNESINKKEVMLKDVNNDLDNRFEDINKNKTNDLLKNDQIKKNRIKTYAYYNKETIQNDGKLYNEYASTGNENYNKDNGDINKIINSDDLLSEQESSINTNSIINDTINTRGDYNEFVDLNTIQKGDDSPINSKTNIKHGCNKIKKNYQEDSIDISQNNVFIEYNKNNLQLNENKKIEYVENKKTPENKSGINNKNILKFGNKNSIINKNILIPEIKSDIHDENILLPGNKTKLHDKTSIDNKNIFTPENISSMHDESSPTNDKNEDSYDNSENITDALISKIEIDYYVNDENLIVNDELKSNQDYYSNDKIDNDINTNNAASELNYKTNVIINNANAPAEFCRSFYKQTRHTQSFADIFSQTENSTSENTTRDDTSILLKSFINEEKEEEKKDKKEEKKEEKEEEKKSFFNFSRFFGAKKKVYKVNIESDAAFIYDPVTKKWINKNENKESKFKATEEKKEIAMPKIINKPLVKGKRGTLEGRYAGYKTGTKNELQTFIPGLKRQKENEEK